MTMTVRIGVLPLLCLLMSACVGLTAAQKNAAGKYASAASGLGQAASTELVKMHDQTVAMNIAMYRLPDLPLESAPFNSQKVHEPIVVTEIKNAEYDKLAGRFAGNWYQVFSSGAEALKAYGQALTDILNADNTAQVKQSSDSFAAALKAIPGAPISSATQTAISNLSQQLTEWLLAKMKAHAIEQIVNTYNADVATVCKGIGDNFVLVDAGEHQPDNFAADFRATAQVLAASSRTAMDLHPNERNVRSDALESWLTAKQNLSETTTVFPTIVKISSGCMSASDALVRALRDRSLSSKEIDDFYAQSKQLYATVKTLSTK